MPNDLAYGFVSMEQLLSRRVNDVGFEVVRAAINLSVQEYNRVTNELFDTVGIRRTTQSKYRFYLPGGEVDMQPLDQWGTPLPTQYSETYYDVGLPMRGAGTAWGTNRVSRAMETVQEANDHVVRNLRADTRWMRRHLLAALFDNVSYVWSDPKEGNLTVIPLANGDGTVYNLSNGATGTDNHYLAQAAAISDANNPYGAIRDELLEHPENAERDVVVYIASNLVATTEALTTFVSAVTDPELTVDETEIRLRRVPEALVNFGNTLLGRVSRVWIVEWINLPNNYMFAMAIGTPDIWAMRLYDETALQGLISETYSPDGARIENRLIRYAGFGVQNRIGAVIQQIGSGTYAIPSGYDQPLPN